MTGNLWTGVSSSFHSAIFEANTLQEPCSYKGAKKLFQFVERLEKSKLDYITFASNSFLSVSSSMKTGVVSTRLECFYVKKLE